MTASRLGLFLLVLPFLARAAFGGTVRYDLPELLGEHRYDGVTQTGGFSHVDTPFGFYAVEQARLVIAGTVLAGKARGDGIIREPLEFDLEPFVQTGASFKSTIAIGQTPTVGLFSFDELYHYPFVPKTTPLPSPAGYPPVSFSVGLGISLSFSTTIPPTIDPNSPYDEATDGVIVDVPIIANVTTAYIELTGAGIVPEPSAWVLATLGSIVCLACTASRPYNRQSLTELPAERAEAREIA